MFAELEVKKDWFDEKATPPVLGFVPSTDSHGITRSCLPGRMFLCENLVWTQFCSCTVDFEFEKKNHILLFNKEGFVKNETGGIPYLQQG